MTDTLAPALDARLDGAAIAADVRRALRDEVAAFTAEAGRAPVLRILLVGEHPASASYVRGKTAAAAEVGIDAQTLRLPADASEADVLGAVRALNADDGVDGILVQLPLPGGVDSPRVLDALDPAKDVDGFHPENVGRVFLGIGGLAPCTPAGILAMLDHAGVQTRGLHAVVVGRSLIVGKPMASLLAAPGRDCTVTLAHRHTQDLAALTRTADLLVVAVGKAGLVTADMVKPGAVVVDVGINRVDDPASERGYRIVGDVDFEGVSRVARLVTPVPGGVGPMTIAMLLRNTLEAARARRAAA